jgi:hypothetical protein
LTFDGLTRSEDLGAVSLVGGLLKQLILPLAVLVFCVADATAQRSQPPDQKELAAITQRGRQLFEYDKAAWHATDAVQALQPTDNRVRGYVAERTEVGWRVLFGALTDDRTGYLVVYEATSNATSTGFAAHIVAPARIERGRTLARALALETCRALFGARGRPFNIAVLDAPDSRHWVYVYPAQTDADVVPHGGDVRYMVGPDGGSVIDTRVLHRTILETRTPKDMKPEMGVHIAVMDDVPEDTDVFLVLSRRPAIPEMIATKNYVYRIDVEGNITYLGKSKDLLK